MLLTRVQILVGHNEDKQVEKCPLAFKGEKCDLWKKRMMSFLQTINLELLETIENDIPTLLDDKRKLLVDNT